MLEMMRAGSGIESVADLEGRTIAYARAHLMAKGATRTLACAFVRKPQALNEPIDAIAWDAPDVFLVGYGIDYAERFRHLPDIYRIERLEAHAALALLACHARGSHAVPRRVRTVFVLGLTVRRLPATW